MSDASHEGDGVQRAPLALVPSLPVYGTHSDEPGPRGCHALKRNGELCGAARRADSAYCNAHSGRGVASDPAGFAPIAQRASAENRRRRAALRLELGITRPSSLRSLLAANVYAERERVVTAALAPIRDSDLGSAAKQRAALALLDAVEPQDRATLDVPLPHDADGIAALGAGDLRALARSVGDS